MKTLTDCSLFKQISLGALVIVFLVALGDHARAGTLQIGTEDADQCIELCKGIAYECTTNNFNPSTKVCTIVTDANPSPQSVFTIGAESEAQCDDLAQATGNTGSWDDDTGICTIGLVYVGCFEDTRGEPLCTGGRVLDGAMTPICGTKAPGDLAMTNAKCVSFCGAKGFRYAGTQYGGYCFCGSETGVAADEGLCNSQCKGNTDEYCGGSWKNSIYLTHGSGGHDATNLGYVGCFTDNRGADPVGLTDRVLNGDMLPPAPAPRTGDPDMTTAKCTNHCNAGGFQYAATQYGAFCFCGDSYGDLGISPNCRTPCSGEPEEVCGGPWANSVYQLY